MVTVTPEARATVVDALSREEDVASLALWLEVSGTIGDAYSYDLYFQATAAASADDVVQHDDGLAVVVPSASVTRLRGATLDLAATDDGGGGGLVIANPNTPPVPVPSALVTGIPLDPDDPMVQRVVAVLDGQVNPSIAVHGGRADVVGVEGTAVYLRLSGGCQGCGSAEATLNQGIEVLLRRAIPELTDIVDVTDHASGTNPYYEPAH